MMNRIRTAAAAAAMLMGAATVASAQIPEQQGQAGRAQRGERGDPGMMRGMDLSSTQREQIQAIHAKYRVLFQQIRERSHPDVEAARAARQAGDTAAARAAMARARGHGTEVAALRQQEQAEVRAVLTAEQRTKLDARNAQMQERRARRDSVHAGDGSRGRDGARGTEGQRPNRGGRPGRGTRP